MGEGGAGPGILHGHVIRASPRSDTQAHEGRAYLRRAATGRQAGERGEGGGEGEGPDGPFMAGARARQFIDTYRHCRGNKKTNKKNPAMLPRAAAFASLIPPQPGDLPGAGGWRRRFFLK